MTRYDVGEASRFALAPKIAKRDASHTLRNAPRLGRQPSFRGRGTMAPLRVRRSKGLQGRSREPRPTALQLLTPWLTGTDNGTGTNSR